jgi:predicted nucleic acid-binding Zn ribbon protein
MAYVDICLTVYLSIVHNNRKRQKNMEIMIMTLASTLCFKL